MLNDMILKRISDYDNNSRNEYGDIEFNHKLQQFTSNLVNDKELEVHDDEDYLDYDIRLSTHPNWLKFPKLKKTDYNYVSSAIDSEAISTWQPGSNVLISAGTGKGKNTFIMNVLLKHYSHINGNIIIFENRESLLSQQKIELIKAVGADSLKYHDLDNDNMIIIGSKKNIMLISYQKAALLLLYQNREFCDFLLNVRYAVFDEVHYLIDDACFNKGINIIADLLIKPMYVHTSPNNLEMGIQPNTYMPYATKIFMSGSMEEVYLYLQNIGYQFSEYNDMSDTKCPDNLAEDFRKICNSQKSNHLINLPTDYSYISPYVYTEYDDIIAKVKISNDKWLVFVNSKSIGYDLEINLNKSCGAGTALFINADNKKSKKVKEVYQKLLQEEIFDVKVLIATNVIYNGINIKDDELKNIVLPETTISTLKQLIGRKRIKNKEEIVNVYFPNIPYDNLCMRLSEQIKEYFDALDTDGNLLNNIAAVNGMKFGISKYTYAYMSYISIQTQNGMYQPLPFCEFKLNELANMKLHFDTMFYLYLLRRLRVDENAYPKVLLEHLGIGEKAANLSSITPLSAANKLDIAKEKMTELLEKNLNAPMVDKCVDGKYELIPKFTEAFNEIYFELKGKAFDSQWKNKERNVADIKFNQFIDELGLDYCIEISKKDKATECKTLLVKSK